MRAVAIAVAALALAQLRWCGPDGGQAHRQLRAHRPRRVRGRSCGRCATSSPASLTQLQLPGRAEAVLHRVRVLGVVVDPGRRELRRGRALAVQPVPPPRDRRARRRLRVRQLQHRDRTALEDITLPLDDDYDELRRQLWLGTDAAYKQATESFDRKQAVAKAQTKDSDDVGSFSHEPALGYVMSVPPVTSSDESAAARGAGAEAVRGVPHQPRRVHRHRCRSARSAVATSSCRARAGRVRGAARGRGHGVDRVHHRRPPTACRCTRARRRSSPR